jgi:hypothetical protein
MLKTFGSAAGRELYAADFLSTITTIPFQAYGRLPMGLCYVTVKTRFAGLHNPTTSVPRPLSQPLVETGNGPQDNHFAVRAAERTPRAISC